MVQDETVTISIVDNGIGFDTQCAEKMFGLFARLNGSEYEGTGLGLAICKRVIERYGGTIRADGSPGKGSTFSFTLPAAPASPALKILAILQKLAIFVDNEQWKRRGGRPINAQI
jgi:signal transduction histidine kinase